MTTKHFPWILAEVPFPPHVTFIRGYKDGLPILSRHCAPTHVLATFRQLRTRGLRPGGADPVAVLYTKHTPSGACNWSSLWRITDAVAVRAMTPARWASIHRALAARRTCRQCDTDTGSYLPKDRPWCDPCRYELDELDPADHLHDYVHAYIHEQHPGAFVLDGYTEPLPGYTEPLPGDPIPTALQEA